MILALALATLYCPVMATEVERPIVWTYEWKSNATAKPPSASICSLKYDKVWAYTVEIDDGPASTFKVSLPLLARFSFTDAPPGLKGGKSLPFVGGSAVFPLRVGTGNSAFLSVAQLAELRKRGWGILNHGYRHVGNSWERDGGLNPAQIEEELFWSQAVLAEETGEGLVPTHFVYPNGYMDYKPHLARFGLRSASRVGGRSRNLLAGDFDPFDIDRNYLDESVWSKTPDAMFGFPETPKLGDLIIDFTHGMEADPASANHNRWNKRLETIAGRFGQDALDNVWCAPASEVVSYSLAAKAAVIEVDRRSLRIEVPEAIAGSALTIKLNRVDPQSSFVAPPGGTLHRSGSTTWITTPPLRGPSPKLWPAVRKLHQGPAKDFTFDKPVQVAGVRLLQDRPSPSPTTLKLELIGPEGEPLVLTESEPGPNWGTWLLFSRLPGKSAYLTRTIRIQAGTTFSKMEVWGNEAE